MMARIKIRSDLADYAEKLFNERVLVIEDGEVSRGLAKALQPLRSNGDLAIGWDRKGKKSILALTAERRKRRRKDEKVWKRTVFTY